MLIQIDIGQRRTYPLEISEQELYLPNLPASLEGKLAAHLTDLHLGYAENEKVFTEVICKLAYYRPDLILLTGDYIDHDKSIGDYPLAQKLSALQAPLGVYASFGNHDHRRGIKVIRQKLKDAGNICILNNENVQISEKFWLAGIDDLHEGTPDVDAAFRGIPVGVPTLILSHNPRLIETIPDKEVVVLSGHTHGGQIRLPFPTPKMVCMFHLHCKQVSGWYRNGKARLYVSRGLGVTGYPLRFRCAAELALFRLTGSNPA